MTDLIEEGPCRLVTGAVKTATTWARCVAPGCVAHGAALDVLNTEPVAEP
ncbi:hypothetical protein [Streptomyces spectabilis]|nr:hypothetical protein [Streptomyces spectabilis]